MLVGVAFANEMIGGRSETLSARVICCDAGELLLARMVTVPG
jgi:hypothetical protein